MLSANHSSLAFGIASAIVLGACAHATPVQPAPVSAADAGRLQDALHGTCEVTATQAVGGARKDAAGLRWTFEPNGHGRFSVPGGMNFGNTFTYRLDGRNVLMDGTYKAIRVDDWSSSTMAWFLYDISEIYYCTKR
jgi:hypothetical protein